MTALLVVGSWVVVDALLIAAWVRLHRVKPAPMPTCHWCELHLAQSGSLFCSAICADLEFGVGVNQ